MGLSMKRAIQYFKQALKQKKLRFTKQREAILNSFLAREGHVCIDELYFALRKKYSRLGYMTVYRTIKLLKNIKMAEEVNFTGRRKRFEHAFEHPHHDHFVCERCGRVIEFSDPEIENRQALLCREYSFSGERHLMQIFGICRRCVK